ncbi:MAG: hypothetical protein JO143_04285 [Acetobacteraceae bacterium]|nr:hypothetical protein [Acetobacteraceae bacterium]
MNVVRRKPVSVPELLSDDAVLSMPARDDAVLSMPEIGIEIPLSELYDRVDFPPETA